MLVQSDIEFLAVIALRILERKIISGAENVALREADIKIDAAVRREAGADGKLTGLRLHHLHPQIDLIRTVRNRHRIDGNAVKIPQATDTAAGAVNLLRRIPLPAQTAATRGE